MLACLRAQEDGTFYIVDAMCWRGYNLCVLPPACVFQGRTRSLTSALLFCSYDCTAEFRLYWLQTKLAECDSLRAPAPPPQVRPAAVSHQS